MHMPALIETMYAVQVSEQAEAAAMALAFPATVDPIIDAGPLGELPLVGGAPQLPLPEGRYPSISAYPHLMASYRNEAPLSLQPVGQPKQRGQVVAHTAAHRDQLLEIRNAVAQLSDEETRFRQQQEEILRAEESRRQLAAEEEERLFEERRRSDEAILQRRLASVRSMCEGVEKSLQQQQKLRAAE